MDSLESRVLLSITPLTCSDIVTTPNCVVEESHDHRWPSINNNGDVVYSAKVGDQWEVFKLTSGSSTPVKLTSGDYNKMYPSIADDGDIVYFKEGGSSGSGWQVMRLSGGSESQLEKSTNRALVGARNANRFASISSDGKSISGYNFGICGNCPGNVRRFNVSGVGRLNFDFGGFNSYNYPDINSVGDLTLSGDGLLNAGSIFKASVNGRFPGERIGTGSMGRINDSGDVVAVLGDLETSGAIQFLAAPDYSPVTVNEGVWADIGRNGEIVFENFDANGVRQLFLFTETPGDIELKELTNEDADTVALTYEIKDENVPEFEIAFYASDDGEFGSGDVQRSTIDITEQLAAGLSLVQPAGQKPEPLTRGEHTLNIEINSFPDLRDALEDSTVKILLAVADPQDDIDETQDNNVTPFRGIIHAGAGRRAVVRTGPYSFDTVTLETTGGSDHLSFTANPVAPIPGPPKAGSVAIPSGQSSQVLVVTSHFDDEIKIGDAGFLSPIVAITGGGADVLRGGAADDLLVGGIGNDTYEFLSNAAGTDTINEVPVSIDTNNDLLDFREYSSPLDLDLGSASTQTFGPLSVRLVNPTGLENVLGTRFGDTIRGNERRNFIAGKLGDDTLHGVSSSAGLGDVLFGGDFELQSALGLNDLINGLLNFSLPLGRFVPEQNDGDDKLFGGSAFDWLVGGFGDDVLEGNDGGGVIFGDTFSTNFSVGIPGGKGGFTFGPIQTSNVKDALQVSLLVLGIEFQLLGNGSDRIIGGSGLDVIFGGDNQTKEMINSGAGLADIIFGNDGDDDIDSFAAFTLAIGGDGDDEIDANGPGGSLLIGDSFDFQLGGGVDIDFAGALAGSPKFSRLEIGAGLLSTGNGNDVLTAAEGVNVVIGGNGNDTITAGGIATFTLGDTFNSGAGFSVDFVEVWDSQKTLDQKLKTISDGLKLPGLAGSGTDIIDVRGQFNIAAGGNGTDTIFGSSGFADILFGNAGNDTIAGGPGFNLLVGGADDDTLSGGDDGNVIFGDTFDFSIPGIINLEALKDGRLVTGSGLTPGGAGDDTLLGGNGFDFLVGGDGDDTLFGFGGLNVLLGDTFSLGVGATVELANFTTDRARVFDSFFQLIGSGMDTITGGAHYDIAIGGGGTDNIRTGGGIDALFGNEGTDFLSGGSGVDFLFGGEANDTLDGGAGIDFMFGGSGRDRFSFDSFWERWSIFSDFDADEDEEMVLAFARLRATFGSPHRGEQR